MKKPGSIWKPRAFKREKGYSSVREEISNLSSSFPLVGGQREGFVFDQTADQSNMKDSGKQSFKFNIEFN